MKYISLPPILPPLNLWRASKSELFSFYPCTIPRHFRHYNFLAHQRFSGGGGQGTFGGQAQSHYRTIARLPTYPSSYVHGHSLLNIYTHHLLSFYLRCSLHSSSIHRLVYLSLLHIPIHLLC